MIKIGHRKYLCERAQIKQKAIFSLDDLYVNMHFWFLFYDFSKYEVEYRVMEQFNRVEIFWICKKQMDPYVQFVIEFAFVVTGLKDVEIEKDGVKLKRNAGTLEFRTTCYMEKDYEDKWRGSRLKELMREAYDKYIIRKRLDDFKNQLYKELQALFAEVRSFLHLHAVR